MLGHATRPGQLPHSRAVQKPAVFGAHQQVAQLAEPFPHWWERLVDELGPRDAARRMARILRGIIELGREECVRRVTYAFLHGEAIATALLVPAAASAIPMTLTLVPAALDVVVECSSVASFDALLQPALEGAA